MRLLPRFLNHPALVALLALPAAISTPAQPLAPASPPAETASTAQSPAVRRKMQALAVVFREAAAAQANSPERARLMEEFLSRSGEFVREQPDTAAVWLLRATAALELDRAQEGWESGRALIRLGLESSPDAGVQNTLVQLERRSWLDEKSPESSAVTASDSALSGEDRLELATLRRMTQTAATQADPMAVKMALSDVLTRSDAFVEKHPDYQPIWHLRARLAVELKLKAVGSGAGQRLKALGALTSTDGKLLATMAELSALGWLAEERSKNASGAPPEKWDPNKDLDLEKAFLSKLKGSRWTWQGGEWTGYNKNERVEVEVEIDSELKMVLRDRSFEPVPDDRKSIADHVGRISQWDLSTGVFIFAGNDFDFIQDMKGMWGGRKKIVARFAGESRSFTFLASEDTISYMYYTQKRILRRSR